MKISRVRRIHWAFCLVVVTGSLTFGARALATEATVESSTHGDDYGYKFKDESLLGSTIAPGGDIYTSRRRFQRVLLVRPKTNFCPELFKSVENL